MFFYESFARDWDSQMNRDELGKRLRLVFGGLLNPEDVRGKNTLDAGAGTGHFSRVLAEWGAKLVSMDLGSALLAQVRSKCASPGIPRLQDPGVPIHYPGHGTHGVCGSLLDLPFATASFDVVLCTEVIEHTTDPRRAVAELCRVVAPDGILVLTVPNKVWRPAVVAANFLKIRPYLGHENWVPYKGLAAWISAAGLAVEHQSGFNLLPHTFFCRPAFDSLDRASFLHPYMINIAVLAKR